jgi:TolB protein
MATISRDISTIHIEASGGGWRRMFSPRGAVIWISAAILLGAIGWMLFLTRQQSEPMPAISRPTVLASWKSEPGEESENRGRFSPDGKFIAFSSTKDGERHIWVKQIEGGEPIPITRDKWYDTSPIWSPDGQRIAFISNRGGQSGIWMTPAFGGTPSLLTTLGEGNRDLICWSKDGQRLYYQLNLNLFALNVASRESTPLTKLDASQLQPRDFSLSPDEKRIAYVDRRDLWVVPLDGGTSVQITKDAVGNRHPVWHPDGRRIIYSSDRDGVYQICQAYLDGRPPAQLTFGESGSMLSDVSSDGARILFSSSKDESDVWGVGLEAQKPFQLTSEIGVELRPAPAPDGETIAFQAINLQSTGAKPLNSLILAKSIKPDGRQMQLTPDGFDPQWSPDGNHLAFLRRAGTMDNLWIVKAAGGGEKQLTSGGVMVGGFSILPYNRMQARDYSWSPDGRQLAYSSKKSGEPELWTIAADGSGETKLSNHGDAKLFLYSPFWSEDGRQLAYLSMKPGAGKIEWGLWLAESGSSTNIYASENVLRLLGWSSNGQSLIAASIEGSKGGSPVAAEVALLQIPITGGSARLLARLSSAYLYSLQLSLDGRMIAFAAHTDGEDQIRLILAAGGEATKLIGNADPRIYVSSLAWSPDGRTIYYGKQANWRLISMIDHFR